MPRQRVNDILNFVPFSDNLGTAGQPTAEQFAVIADAGYKLVVNLAMPDSPETLPNEAEVVAAYGMTYINIPVVWSHPTAQNLEDFFAVLDAHHDEKVCVHCIVNKRASAFAFLYDVQRLGTPIEESRAKMNRVWAPNGIWQRFVEEALNDG